MLPIEPLILPKAYIQIDDYDSQETLIITDVIQLYELQEYIYAMYIQLYKNSIELYRRMNMSHFHKNSINNMLYPKYVVIDGIYVPTFILTNNKRFYPNELSASVIAPITIADEYIKDNNGYTENNTSNNTETCKITICIK